MYNGYDVVAKLSFLTSLMSTLSIFSQSVSYSVYNKEPYSVEQAAW